MSELTINVKVSVGITPTLENLLTRLLTPSTEAVQLDTEVSRTSIEANKACIEASEKSIEANNAYLQTLNAAPTDPKQPAEDAPTDTPEPTPPTNQDPAPVEAAAPVYDVVFVREAIDRTRRRIEGENYKQETTSELYKKYHKALTGEFKRIATQLSAGTPNPTDKPTELPNDLRKKFSDACDEIYVGENGQLEIKLPF